MPLLDDIGWKPTDSPAMRQLKIQEAINAKKEVSEIMRALLYYHGDSVRKARNDLNWMRDTVGKNVRELGGRNGVP